MRRGAYPRNNILFEYYSDCLYTDEKMAFVLAIYSVFNMYNIYDVDYGYA